MPPGVINMLPGDGIEVSDVVLHHPDLAGIHFTGSTPTFQKLWGTVGENLVVVPLLPAHRRRDRRQGLHRRAPLGRRRRAARRDDARRLRVPGPEVLGRLARLRAARRSGRSSRTSSSRRPRTSRWARRHRPVELHGRGHRRPGVRQAQEGDHPGQAVQQARGRRRRPGRRLDRLLRAADDRAVRPTRPTRCSRTSTSDRSSPCTCTTTAGSSPWSTRWSRSRRTP